jgi:hypothetical protein
MFLGELIDWLIMDVDDLVVFWVDLELVFLLLIRC